MGRSFKDQGWKQKNNPSCNGSLGLGTERDRCPKRRGMAKDRNTGKKRGMTLNRGEWIIWVEKGKESVRKRVLGGKREETLENDAEKIK